MIGGSHGFGGGVGSPDFTAGVSVGLSLAAKLAVGMGASLADACGECAVCAALSDMDRDVVTAGLRTGRVMCAEMADEMDGLAEYVMGYAVYLGYVPPKDDAPHG